MTAAAVSARCTGHCCRRFPLSVMLDRLREIAGGSGAHAAEAAQISDMLVVLEPADLNGEVREMFTCQHHDAATGDCRIYPDRPRMCRDYPYGRACEHLECTAESRDAGLVPLRIEREPRVLAEEVATERTAALNATAPEYRPGARQPGHKPPPPVPSWARDRQRGAAGRPGR